ncbi:MAG: bifunctional (p)ppGpp synthetase/guanosine-3',5'-bis(diphosphate) 3'-pyrophosphohydrolase [Clostridia bacterium]|nr:bifunctional (p)ppGpp synthetase/guanosine-3',5'-bis(diphosphate) 3'-pyrophosphohydrolase [Clostridia bacterium]
MVKEYAPNSNTDLIYVAYRLAEVAHKGQKRKSGAPYIDHPVQIAYIAAQLKLDVVAIEAALLHDVIEDTPYTFENIEMLFGKDVAEIVDGVTKLRKLQYNTREEQQVENLRKMLLAMAKDIRVVIIKLIDRLHNMRTMKFMPPDRQLAISKETLDVYAPLAHRLGMSKIKSELEDLSLKYLDPVAYEEIRESIKQKKDERDNFVKEIMDSLKEKLKSLSIEAEVTGRAKHFYSIFRKMYAQNKSIDELYDLFAVRIIVNSIQECYAVLGMVHEMYTPIPMRFKDYIAMPKPNMYQSLHTTVIGTSGTPFEIQIRTWDMHKVAEEGIAAHWKYKEGKSGANEMDGKLEWVRKLLETQVDIIDTDDFMSTLKIDLFSDEVFAFTPNGKVISLPSKSTVIDFAFAIHTEIGCKMSGAKINGRIVPNTTILENGDIVEILTSSSVKGPNRDWLKHVKTPHAKNKINQWLKKECREENIETGRILIDKEIRRLNMTHNQLMKPEWLQPMLKKYNFQTIEDLYAGVGYGGLSAQKVVLRLRDIYTQEKKKNPVITNEVTVTDEKPKRKVRQNGIEVYGIDNCLVRLSRCCNPVPGDEIVGFITKGRGVSVHRADCPNMQPSALSEEDRNRFIDVSWAEDDASQYIATIQVDADNRPGMMMVVSGALSDMKLNCTQINAKANKKGYATMTFDVEIHDTSTINKAINKIRTIPGVLSVNRAKNI